MAGLMAISITVGMAGPANGWAVASSRPWNWSYTGTYCYSTSVAAHTSWLTYIAQDVGKWNGLRTTTVYSPVFTAGCNGHNATDFLFANLGAGLCGSASNNHVYYNTAKTYGGRNGVVGQCNFDWTTLHEWGHTLGVEHSCQSGAVMWYADNGVTNLTTDDKNAIYYWYSNQNPPGKTLPC